MFLLPLFFSRNDCGDSKAANHVLLRSLHRPHHPRHTSHNCISIVYLQRGERQRQKQYDNHGDQGEQQDQNQWQGLAQRGDDHGVHRDVRSCHPTPFQLDRLGWAAEVFVTMTNSPSFITFHYISSFNSKELIGLHGLIILKIAIVIVTIRVKVISIIIVINHQEHDQDRGVPTRPLDICLPHRHLQLLHRRRHSPHQPGQQGRRMIILFFFNIYLRCKKENIGHILLSIFGKM